ncbi:sulfite oxidase [Grosmannia clavigera kw1407]|uniref:Nitrate reductase [NADPH] n=1 Tax=Grosmannia clavigera (strain kw1407 / UAMH 11150) TaxID=655863 RepID=F0XJL8_GROCL|nr:sulfite oxidase [Grosmannia clavigera kw1407]EFX02297.1 sulfite oxidase [Grosmannia clavigera kw1407]
MATAASLATRSAARMRSLAMRRIDSARTACLERKSPGLWGGTSSPRPPSIGHQPALGRRCPFCTVAAHRSAQADRTDKRQTRKGGSSGPESARLTLLAGVGLFSAVFAMLQPLSVHVDVDEQYEHVSDTASDDRDPSLPRYRLADIRKHDARSAMPWVTSGDKVYDITDWVAAHPGGPVILQAAGGSIDPYWDIFTIHKAPHVYDILAQYLIGLVDAADLVDGKPAATDIADPFASDPVRDGRLLTHTAKPCNAEPPPTELGRTFVTANELFYVRNHMWVPVVDRAAAQGHELAVELPDGAIRTYTLDELRRRFRRHRVTAVLQCSGNRRSDMTRAVAKTNGLQWGVGAISNAVWEGVLLRDVLADAGLQLDEGTTDQLHVQLAGMEAYAASIPLPTALDPRGDVLLAFAMNGEPLPRDHGFPLRAVVPGHVAARSVKWLSRVVVADEESPSQWQRRDYKLFGPNEGGKPDWDRYPAIQEMPLTSAITGIWVGREGIQKAGQQWLDETERQRRGDGARAAAGERGDPRTWQKEHLSSSITTVEPEPVAVTGYAYSGGGREIVRVDVSLDGGRTWDQAELLDRRDDDGSGEIVARGTRDWAWKRWRYAGRLLPPKGDDVHSCAEIVVKTVDAAYNTQPERHDGIYNVRGNLATAWHRVRLCPTVGLGRTVTWTMDGCGFGNKK